MSLRSALMQSLNPLNNNGIVITQLENNVYQLEQSFQGKVVTRLSFGLYPSDTVHWLTREALYWYTPPDEAISETKTWEWVINDLLHVMMEYRYHVH